MKSIIVAMDKNQAIGFNGDLPWGRGLKDDLAHFKTETKGKSIIMGRKTFESIGSRPLPERENIVVTHRPTGVKGVLSAASLEAAYSLARHDIAIIGGGQIYQQSLGDIDRLSVTHVDGEFLEASVFFPEVDFSQWHEVSRRQFNADERNAYAFDIVEYIRA